MLADTHTHTHTYIWTFALSFNLSHLKGVDDSTKETSLSDHHIITHHPGITSKNSQCLIQEMKQHSKVFQWPMQNRVRKIKICL